MSQRVIFLNIDREEWNQAKMNIENIDFSVQFLKQDGTLREKTYHKLKYNELTEGIIVLLQLGDKYPLQLLANNKQLFEEMRDVFGLSNNKKHMLFTNFSEPFDLKNKAQINKLGADLGSHFLTNNELVNQIRKEKDHGSTHYMYRYYSNNQRLRGSSGISEVDMTCDAFIKLDDGGVLSLFVNSDIELTPFAVLEN
ncbi:MAG: hypothetical protein ACJA01_003653 [Saprospiraceae bacterium]